MSRTRLRRYFRHGLVPQLLVFEAVARLGSVTRAAEELHLAQPTVSVQLKKLSSALDVVLLEQRGRQLYLTAAGWALRDTCEELKALLARMDERFAPWRRRAQTPPLDSREPATNNPAAWSFLGTTTPRRT